MSKLLIIEDSKIICDIFDELLNKYTNFDFSIAKTYEEAKSFLRKSRYEFAVADMNLPDAKCGEIIPLLNKHNIAPIVFTGIFSEEFRESFESANIVDYVLKDRYENILYVIEKLKQLELNKEKKILIVDDSAIYIKYLQGNLKIHRFKIITAKNGKEALEQLELHRDVELMITDYHMPVMDGLELVRTIRKQKTKKELSIIVLTADKNSYTTSEFLKEGANDYITKPFFKDAFYSRIYQNIKNIDLFDDMRLGFDEDIINLFCELTEFKSSETSSHINRISEYSYILAKLNGMFEDEARLIGKLAVLHDIGKITISDAILLKPAKLTKYEFDTMKLHTTNGAILLGKAFKSDKNVGKIAIDIAMHHHEKWDGTGYPDKLSGKDIPTAARIVGLVDVFDALINKRVYKNSWRFDDVVKYIKENSGIFFDPNLTKLFLKNIDMFMSVLEKYRTFGKNKLKIPANIHEKIKQFS